MHSGLGKPPGEKTCKKRRWRHRGEGIAAGAFSVGLQRLLDTSSSGKRNDCIFNVFFKCGRAVNTAGHTPNAKHRVGQIQPLVEVDIPLEHRKARS